MANLVAKFNKILLVEDDEDQQRIISMFLRKNNYEVFLCCDGQEALDNVQKINPQLIIMDCFMPRMNGPIALQHLKRNPNTRNIPVLLISVDKVDTLGCGFLQKPFNTNQLITLIRNYEEMSILHNNIYYN